MSDRIWFSVGRSYLWGFIPFSNLSIPQADNFFDLSAAPKSYHNLICSLNSDTVISPSTWPHFGVPSHPLSPSYNQYFHRRQSLTLMDNSRDEYKHLIRSPSIPSDAPYGEITAKCLFRTYPLRMTQCVRHNLSYSCKFGCTYHMWEPVTLFAVSQHSLPPPYQQLQVVLFFYQLPIYDHYYHFHNSQQHSPLYLSVKERYQALLNRYSNYFDVFPYTHCLNYLHLVVLHHSLHVVVLLHSHYSVVFQPHRFVVC